MCSSSNARAWLVDSPQSGEKHRAMTNLSPGNYFFLVPIFGFIPWYGMLIAMLICWAGQGRPIYWFMHEPQSVVYISDIGATNLNPLFISCAGWQGLFLVISMACEFYQRSGYWPFRLRAEYKTTADERSENGLSFNSMKSQYSDLIGSARFLMPPWYTRHERNLIFASFVNGLIGELGLLFCAIFTTAEYPHVHTAMVTVFIVFMLLCVCCNIAEYMVMGRHYALLHPLATQSGYLQTIDELKWYQWRGHVWNKFTISGVAKIVWLALAIVWAICFGAIDDRGTSACFEWLLAFWFGIFFMLVSVDFYLGGRYKKSRYFRHVQTFAGYYKYDELLASTSFHHVSIPSTPEEVVIADANSHVPVPMAV